MANQKNYKGKQEKIGYEEHNKKGLYPKTEKGLNELIDDKDLSEEIKY